MRTNFALSSLSDGESYFSKCWVKTQPTVYTFSVIANECEAIQLFEGVNVLGLLLDYKFSVFSSTLTKNFNFRAQLSS